MMSGLEGWQDAIRSGEISQLPDDSVKHVGCAVGGVIANPSRRAMGAVCSSSTGDDSCSLPFGKCEHQRQQ